MANTIKLKRASGSDPGASDLVVGEVAIRTDTAKLFTKKDDNSVAEIGVTALGDNDVTTSKIADDAVTYAKIQNVSATNRILGRDSSGAGVIEEITPANLRTMLNVEDGATADQSASEILTLIKTVDGAGSGLDADTLDGISSASFLRSDANDTIDATLTVGGSSVSAGEGGEIQFTQAPDGSLNGSTVNVDINGNNFRIFEGGSNNRGVFIDLTTCANSAAGKLYHSGNDGSGSGLDSDLLDGQEGSYYRNASNINAGTLAAARVATLNQDTTGNAATATTATNANHISVADNEDTNENNLIPFIENASATGNVGLESDGHLFYNPSEGKLTSPAFAGNGAALTNLSGSNIASGTVAAARVATLNQDTTGNAASADSVDVSGVTTDAALQVLFSTSNDGQAKTIAVDSTSSKFTYNPSSNTLTVDTVVAALTGNASGSSGSCTGNAATATALANARTIAGVSFDGTANISLNNNAITNGAGYITSADGGNAATLDSIDSSQFLRSDTADTASGVLSISLGLSFGANSKCAAAVSSLSDGGTITVDFESGIHHSVTLGGNRTLSANNEGNTVGQSGSIFITQDGTGSRTLAYTSDYKFAGGTAPTLSTAANAVDRLDYVIKADGVVHCVVTLDVK